MRDQLAERLLAEVMQWNAEDLVQELPHLQALASLKYDDYQQFTPGMKFLESLAIWINQFETKEEKELVYKFVREHLIFISSAEMTHLVSISYPDYIRPYLIKKVIQNNLTKETDIRKIINSTSYLGLLRKSLFIGLTEGAHLDIFRGDQISHEQILLFYDISDDKCIDIKASLNLDLEKIYNKKVTEDGIY